MMAVILDLAGICSPRAYGKFYSHYKDLRAQVNMVSNYGV